MDILIKSFNRPYYLDRCLQSIYRYCIGFSSIKVMDDGTPEKYLNKIKEKYPDVIILKSNQFHEKNNAISENLQSGKEIDGFSIPAKFWKDTVKEASEFFVITEDDVWFTQSIDLSLLENCMKSKNTDLIKLGNLGKPEMGVPSQCKGTELVYPQYSIFTAPEPFFRWIFFNKCKTFSLLYRLKFFTNDFHSQYYFLFSILMGMYRKSYWLKLWEGIDGRVSEYRQMYNAGVHFRKNKSNKSLIGSLKTSAMTTTFKSSATNSYHKYGTAIDINRFNYILNEYWYKDYFDAMENFPKDFSDTYITSILTEENHPDAQPDKWLEWAEKFKDQYRSRGYKIE